MFMGKKLVMDDMGGGRVQAEGWDKKGEGREIELEFLTGEGEEGPPSFYLNPNNYAFSTLRISLPLPLPSFLPFLPPFHLNPNIYAFPSYLPPTPSPVIFSFFFLLLFT